MMRIITGSARGTKLLSNEGIEVRPTTERTKEGLFSSIQFDIRGKTVLDLFSGTGQLALEALSRGALSAVLVDNSKASLDIIKKNAEKTHLISKCEIVYADYITYLTSAIGQTFDIIFIDPPYNKGLVPKVLEKLDQNKMISPSTIIICESEDSDKSVFGNDEILKDTYKVFKSSKYSASFITILKPLAGED